MSVVLVLILYGLFRRNKYKQRWQLLPWVIELKKEAVLCLKTPRALCFFWFGFCLFEGFLFWFGFLVGLFCVFFFFFCGCDLIIWPVNACKLCINKTK